MTIDLIVSESGLRFFALYPKEVRRALRSGTAKAGQVMKKKLRMQVRTTFKRVTGKFERSFKVKTKGTLESEIGSTAPQAKIQDRGGKITAKNASGFLTIPLIEGARGKSTKQYGGKLFRPGPPGNKRAVLAESGGPGIIRPVYALKHSVTIHATGYIEKARRAALPEIEQVYRKVVADAVKKAAGIKK